MQIPLLTWPPFLYLVRTGSSAIRPNIALNFCRFRLSFRQQKPVSSAHALPAVLRFSPAVAANSSATSSRFVWAAPGVALFTRATTIKNTQAVTGRTESFIVETALHEDGDHVFLEMIDESAGVVRLVLPPRVCNAIAAQRESLTARRRSIASKLVAQARKDRGERPAFMKKKRAA